LLSLTGLFDVAHTEGFFLAGLTSVALAFPLGRIRYPISLKQNNWKEWYGLALIATGLISLVLFLFATTYAWPVFVLFALGFIVYTWAGISNY
jgi:hypothetical protein